MIIARLRGQIDDVGLDGVLVDVGGVGYPVQVSTRTRAALPGRDEIATLLIETQLREDSVTYFGFVDRTERDWFRHLTTVQGVGGKVALAILSVLDPDRLAQAIVAQDKASLARADGVGPKLAARLVTELKDRATAWAIGTNMTSSGIRPQAVPAADLPDAVRDAVAALVGLQFKPVEAQGAVAAASRRLGEAATTGELVRTALQEFAR
ncbi:MAG TPA: Holliday junction branch migration protein RuvA [Stellaceae bacterium]|nr:Holliday junction branch migration protein RuvA [Stellaceae bacterium]